MNENTIAMTQDREMEQSRRTAAWRRRPLIIDDDGDMVYDERTPQGADAFTQMRHTELVRAGVASLAWCIHWGICVGTAESVRYWQTQKLGIPFQDNMPDPTPIVERFCHQHGIEVFGSIRMNDGHDAFGLPSENLLYPLKVEHPEFLLGDEALRGTPFDGIDTAMWSGLNYAIAEVREDRLWWICHTATYNLDGIDLNFFRMPWLFKIGEEAANTDAMTEFIRSAQQIVNAASAQRNRPLLLGVRVPDTIEACLGIGIDIERWLKEGLVDRMLSGGGYASFSAPAKELVDLGHQHDVPVYPCINCPPTFDLGKGLGFESMRGAAANIWDTGADGIYLWNYHYLKTPHIAYGQPQPDDYGHLADLADPKRLKGLDKIFSVNPAPWEQYARASAPCPLPVELDGDCAIPIRIADDVSAASKVLLQLDIANLVAGDQLQVEFNDQPFADVDAAPEVELNIEKSAVKLNVNNLSVTITRRGAAADTIPVLTGVRVWVKYK
jgi:hypothetical protein